MSHLICFLRKPNYIKRKSKNNTVTGNQTKLTIIEEQCKDWAKRIPSLIAIASVMLTSKQTRPLTILKPTTLLAESWIAKPNPTLPSLLNHASVLSFRTWEGGIVHLIFLWEEFWEPSLKEFLKQVNSFLGTVFQHGKKTLIGIAWQSYQYLHTAYQK